MWLEKFSKTERNTRIDLSNHDIIAINVRTFWIPEADQVEILDLSNNWLGYIDDYYVTTSKNACLLLLQDSIFDALTNLKELYLQRNILEYLDKGVFKGLINLKILNLEQNLLITLEKNLFDGLERLKELNLKNNRLKNLPGEIFDGLSHLNGLYLEPQDENGLSYEQLYDFKMIVDQNKGTCGKFTSVEIFVL